MRKTRSCNEIIQISVPQQARRGIERLLQKTAGVVATSCRTKCTICDGASSRLLFVRASWTFSAHIRSLCMTPICVHFSVVSAGLLKPCCLAAVLCVMTKATMRSASRAACSFLRTYQRVAKSAQRECRIHIQRCAAHVCEHHPRSTPPSSLAITPHLRMCWYKT